MTKNFAINPTSIDIQRSKFKRNYTHKTTFNAGLAIPFFYDEVLPGDTYKLETSFIVRSSTPFIKPIMDDMYLDTYYFFVPNRLTWDHWINFMGENTSGAWVEETEYRIPQITAPAGTGWEKNTLADYFSIPTKVPGISIDSTWFRAYALIYNNFFRDENLIDPLYIPLGEETVEGVNTDNQTTDVYKGGMPAKVAKYHDYFTSALPEPQKGADVLLPLGELTMEDIPIVSGKELHDTNGNIIFTGGPTNTNSANPLYVTSTRFQPDDTKYEITGGNTQAGKNLASIKKTNLVANGTTSVQSNATINQLRTAFQIQKLLEKDARGGTRYPEMIKSHFGITSPDARQQRPEYLGGNKKKINITQITNTAQSTDNSLGEQGAYSLTASSNFSFTKSFTEHGKIIGIACIRYLHSYQQGIHRMFSRKQRTDFYFPVLANLGEQGILNKEIYAQGNEKDNEIFGYQERWAEYRYRPNVITGEFRSNNQTTLDIWHLGDNYKEMPMLSPEWITEDIAPINRALTATDKITNQWIADFYFNMTTARPMPVWSIPGLIDHH